MKRIIQFSFTITFICFSGIYNLANAQKPHYENAFEIAIVPSISPFDFSYYQFVNGNSIKNKHNLRLSSLRYIHYGLGVQLQLWNDWQATLNFNITGTGGGVKHNFNGDYGLTLKYGTTAFGLLMNQFNLNIEKKLWHSNSYFYNNTSFSFATYILGGAGMNWTTANDPILSKRNTDQALHEDSYKSETLNYYSGTLSIGWSNQLFINKRQSLKLGILYTYGLQPIEKATFDITYTESGNTFDEHFQVLTGHHRLLIYASYPIALFRNKAQKQHIGKRKTLL